MYGINAPTMRRLAIKVLSQTTSAFALIHTKKRNKLGYGRLAREIGILLQQHEA